MKVEKLLCGAVDFHWHTGPSVISRKFDVVEALKLADQYQMAAIVAKDHQFSTAMVVPIVNKYFTKPGGCKVFSSIALNNSLGGLNLEALKTAYGMGAKVVWMPTISTENHFVKHSIGGLPFPKINIPDSKVDGIENEKPKFIKHLKDDGTVTDEIKAIVSYVARNPDLVLATGHATAPEVDAVIQEALSLGVKKIVATHPGYMIEPSFGQMEEWASRGVFLEIGVGTSCPGSDYYKFEIEDVIRLINLVGPERIVIDTDLGQKDNIHPIEGFIKFLSILYNKGIPESQLTQMIRENPRYLLDI